jgi:hypothetical protein
VTQEASRRIDTISFVAGLCCLLPVVAQAETATVRAGSKTEIATHSRFDSKCEAARVEIKLINPPTNGKVSWAAKDYVVPAVNRSGVKQPAQCVGKTLPGVAVYYEPNASFRGADSFRYSRINTNKADDRFNSEVSYTVEVK